MQHFPSSTVCYFNFCALPVRHLYLTHKTGWCLGGGLALLDLQADAAVDVGPLGRPA
jgi:hypothetical protein